MENTSSCVIASFNHVQFIEESIASIYKQVDEVIVVDDASRDGSYEVLEKLQSRIPNLRLHRNQQNLGPSSAFNLGAKLATGNYLILQGSDDISIDGRVERQLDTLNIDENILSHSRPTVIDEFSNEVSPEQASEFQVDILDTMPMFYLLYQHNYICAPSVAIRRDDFFKAGCFTPNLDALQDYELWLKLSTKGAFQEECAPVVSYRKHSNNLSKKIPSHPSFAKTRLEFELAWIITNFLLGIDSKVSNEIFKKRNLVELECNSDFERDLIQRLFLLLDHPNSNVKMEGVRQLMSLSQQTNFSPHNDLQVQIRETLKSVLINLSMDLTV